MKWLLLPLLLLAGCADPAAAPPAATAAAPDPAEEAARFRADALAIEPLINQYYAYPERFEGGAMPMSDRLRAEAAAVSDQPSLLRYAERALLALADHHAITGASFSDSWAVVPSYSDLWVNAEGGAYAIEAVRADTPAERAGIRPGDRLVAVEGVAVAEKVAAFWADLGLPVTEERAGFAARVLAAGRRDRPRRLTVATPGGAPREFELPNLYYRQLLDRPILGFERSGGDLVITINDSLGMDATIAAFDRAMAEARPGQRVVIDLRDTASGGNTTVARAMMGWFVTNPTAYQIHSLPAEERETGVPRMWIEQVLPRGGRSHDGPVRVLVGRWTGSMGEGLAIGFDAIGAEIVGSRMAGLLGAIYDHRLEHSGLVLKIPTERLMAIDYTPREHFVPGERRYPTQ